jgi:transcriptional regulator with XRE-family HTH domain
MSSGRTKLAAYLRRRNLTHEAFARQAGIPTPSVSYWLAGLRRPNLDTAFKVERATDGAIPARSWTQRDARSPARATS